MRVWLNRVYDAAGVLAAFFMVGVLLMVLAAIFGRMFDFYLRGTDAYAGYCMAAASFLALAHTLRRGEHIRVTLLLQHAGPRLKRGLEIWGHFAASVLSGALAFYSVRLAWQSHTFHDVSQGNDATPLWIPQIAMALGAVILFVAFIDGLFAHLSGNVAAVSSGGDEPARVE